MERNTKQKDIILNVLKENIKTHITADDVVKRLNNVVSKSTIYRELSRLQKKGVLKKYVTGDKSGACYKYIENGNKCEQHYHLVCDKCDKLIHEDNIDVQKIKEKLIMSEGFELDTSSIVFHGICKECNKFKKESK